THDVEEALRLADRIVVMQQGQVVQYDTPFNVLTRPANAFVADLIGADDIVRQLGLIQVAAAMLPLATPLPPSDQPTIALGADLRHALSLLLQTGTAELTVLDNAVPVGLLSLEHIRHLTRRPEAV
ncbi:MAG: ABC transporter ATP-binding protein, partial [Herpetosiphonaceae bacterium]|nr:ABC transporter ATP-binding protein [Herpetosiphonaceae bacterium]